MGVTHIPRSGWTASGNKVYADGMVFRHLDTNGDGTGTKEMTGNYALSPEEFFFEADNVTFLYRMIVQYQDAGNIIARQYGAGIVLANGIDMEVRDRDDNVLIDLLDGIPITGNDDWAHVCYDLTIGSALGSEKLFAARWTFAKSGCPIVLKPGEKLVARFNDDFSGLISQTYMVQGYKV
jgi:hypothetical protein